MANLESIREERLKKLATLNAAGLSGFPINANLTHSLAEIVSVFDDLATNQAVVTIGGRVMARRGQGGLFFADLFDGTQAVIGDVGNTFQAVLKKDTMAETDFNLFADTVDIGDFISVTGTLFTTNRGEKSVAVTSWAMLSKSLRPLPEKWHGLQDTEERFRRRYLDTLMNNEVRARFIARAKIITTIRRVLDEAGFLEVETPILQTLAGGATAEPFTTHHNALDEDFYLRIAPELFLKKLLVGGFPKVYELGRLFRNEGIDTTHNPEFTTVEFYEAFATATSHRAFIESLMRTVVTEACGGTTFTFGDDTIDVAPAFAIVRYLDLFTLYAGIENAGELTRDQAAEHATRFNLTIEPSDTLVKILDIIYKKICRPEIIQPTFLIDYPAAFSPLAKRREDDPTLIDRFQLVMGGFELVNAFSELNDPLDQRERFMEQERNKAAGDAEAQPNDEDYLEALEYGMPPAGGVGLGIDRLTMLLTNVKNIKEVILFPTLKPKQD